MTGRGIDQILPHHVDLKIYESYLQDAKGYIEIAEKRFGPISRPVEFSYIWGDNWGYDIPKEHTSFARALISETDVDIIHGHSSHHILGIEVCQNRPIIYGCGAFITDYEGIRGYEEFRGNLSLIFFLSVEAGTGRLIALRLEPFI